MTLIVMMGSSIAFKILFELGRNMIAVQFLKISECFHRNGGEKGHQFS